MERDRLLMFIDKLLYHRQNVKLFLDTNGVRVLVDLVTLAHLHTQRAYVPLQTSALEASPDQQKDTEKEWYYGNKDKEREGPYSFGEVGNRSTWCAGTNLTWLCVPCSDQGAVEGEQYPPEDSLLGTG